MSKQKYSGWVVAGAATVGAAVAAGLVTFATDYLADQRSFQQTIELDRASIRESYLIKIEDVFQEFDGTFQVFLHELTYENNIEDDVRNELLQNLQLLTSNVISLNNALGESIGVERPSREYQDYINSTRKELLNVSDGGELKPLLEAYAGLRAEQDNLLSTVRKIPLAEVQL